MRPFSALPLWVRGFFTAAAVSAGLFLMFRYLLPLILPFAAALLLARLMEPAVRFMDSRWRIPRKVSAGLLTLFTVALLLLAAGFFISWVFREINDLLKRAPAIIAEIPEFLTEVNRHFERMTAGMPEGVRDMLTRAAEGALAGGASIPGAAVQKLAGWVSSFAGALPGTLLSLCAVVLSTFLISSEFPSITQMLVRPFPKNVRERIQDIKLRLFATMGGWIRAQSLMMMITFGVLLIGFVVLKIKPVLLPALLIALVDALPVLGAGICLLPWALVCFLAGDTSRAAGLAVLYGIAVLVRAFAEPKLLGAQIGLPALPSFMSMYVGFVTAGVPGMVLFPIFLTTGRQVWQSLSKKH